MKKAIWGVAAMLLFVFVMALLPASATTIEMSSGDAGKGGNIFLLGGGNASGTGIPIDLVTVTGAPMNNGAYDTTGTALGFDVSETAASLSFNTATNFIQIVGGIPSLGVADGTTLLSGTFTSFLLTTSGLDATVKGSGPDSKSPALLAALGLPTNTPFNFFSFDLGVYTGTDGRYHGLSSDIVNETPEPGTLVLLGSGLVSLGGLVRRKKLSRA